MTSRTAAALVAALAVAAPAAQAIPAPQGGGGGAGAPDGIRLHRSGYLVTQDARTTTPAPTIDRRSPDAIDAGRGATPAPRHVSPVLPSVSRTSDGGFDWGDAGIGALAMLGIGALGAGTAAVVSRHRRRLQRPVAAG